MTSYSQLHHYFIHSPPCRSIAYSNDSCDNEIFSTPPSSPQPQINIQKSTQTNSPNRYGQNHQPFFILFIFIFLIILLKLYSDRHQSEQRKTREESFKRELEEELQRQREKTEKGKTLLYIWNRKPVLVCVSVISIETYEWKCNHIKQV